MENICSLVQTIYTFFRVFLYYRSTGQGEHLVRIVCNCTKQYYLKASDYKSHYTFQRINQSVNQLYCPTWTSLTARFKITRGFCLLLVVSEEWWPAKNLSLYQSFGDFSFTDCWASLQRFVSLPAGNLSWISTSSFQATRVFGLSSYTECQFLYVNILGTIY